MILALTDALKRPQKIKPYVGLFEARRVTGNMFFVALTRLDIVAVRFSPATYV